MRGAARSDARRAPYLVRRRDIDDRGSNAGRFRTVAIGPSFLPGLVTRTTGWFCIDTLSRVAALTFDDGPHPTHTPAILDVLARHGVPATFFVLAEPARRYPHIVRRAAEEGHEIGLHGNDHRSIKTMGAVDFHRMLRTSRSVAEHASGRRVRLYRPPYLHYHAWQLPLIRANGLVLAMASGAAQDWNHDSEAAIAARGIDCLFPGSVVLLHDDRADPESAASSEELPRFDRADVADRIVQAALQRGFELVTFSELMRRDRGVSSLLRHT